MLDPYPYSLFIDSMENFTQNNFLEYKVFHPNLKEFDGNDLKNTRYLEGRKILLKNFLEVPIEKIGREINELSFTTCFNIYEEQTVTEFLTENQNRGFMFVVQETNRTFVTCISYEAFGKIINEPNLVYLNCLKENERKKTINLKIVQIPNEYGLNWLTYLAPLRNLILTFKKAVFYLVPAMNLRYRMSISATEYIGRPTFIGNQHCQEGVDALVYAIQICKGTCPVSEKVEFDNQNIENYNYMYNILKKLSIPEILQAFEDEYHTEVTSLFRRIYLMNNQDVYNFNDFVVKLTNLKDKIKRPNFEGIEHYFKNLIDLFENFANDLTGFNFEESSNESNVTNN
jgi:hypothetical protein